MTSPSRTSPQFMIRLATSEMRDALKAAAVRNGRSLNAEINHRLAASFDVSNPQLRSTVEAMRPDVESAVERMVQSVVEARLRKIAAAIGAQS